MKREKRGTPDYLKHLNKKKVIQTIQKEDGLSRAQLSTLLNISKPTISNIVDELVAEGWVEEIESHKSHALGGRKPVQLYFNKNARYLIGIDIGGTLVELAVLNMEGEILKQTSFPTQQHVQEDFIQTLTHKVNQLLEETKINEDQILSVGVGVPGITDVEQGIVFEAPSLNWKNYPLKDELEEVLPFSVYVDNDVNVAVLGERWKGAAKDKDNIILITLGTGVGCGLMIEGQLYRGSEYAAGEIGYMVTDKTLAEKKYEPIFAGYGFLDNHVGGPAIVKRMKEKVDESFVRGFNIDELTAKDVFDLAYEQRNQHAQQVIDEAVMHISYAVVNVVSLMNPECVVLGGGISKSGDRFLPAVKERIDRHVPIHTEVYVTELPGVSLIGAASLCLREHDSLFKEDA